MTSDIVYVVRPGEQNEELRYSLRSLANVPHGQVWIAGHMPRWLQDVQHIPVPSRPGSHTQVKANIRAACQHPEVSEEFVYMNDDFFVMQQMDSIPAMHRGTIEECIRTAGMRRAYTRAMSRTMELLQEQGIADPLMYDLHAPMVVTKSGMLEALDLVTYPMMHERTLYGNLQAIGGEPSRNHKVHRSERGWQAWPFISTNDVGFKAAPVGEYIRGRFPTPSAYEQDPPPVTARTARAMRRPVRYRSRDSVIRRVSRRTAA